MDIKQLEAEARFVAKHAKHNLNLIQGNPDMVLPESREKIIADLKNMDGLHQVFEQQNKKDRRPGQSRLRTHLKNLVVSILRDDSQKGKGEIA
ncbi:hypothetical protein DMN77_18825 [Paenibacillus sp. 79R4]|uniref:hypothetical protein n=1 Tax=Paenibacillus sp. 79R4 TaxID=2212847 RepID=UPI0015BBE87D|nr:hypothetical protein [Paenibacillus sp. 79R4]NWL89605.1 hypothetical protein [Paenibacillus sp. 79R4]